jgi:hypothetical protein
MAAFLLLVVGLAAWLYVRLKSAFLANPALNAVLIGVWLIGIVYIFLQTLKLRPEIKWVHAVQRNRLAANELEPPALMGSLARLMEDRTTQLTLSPTALRAVLDGIAVRLDESREIARYVVGLMIFLGLLGTFWGLLKTVGSVGGVVNGLSMTADPTELFTTLKSGLAGPLDGMSTAFGSSLLGLAGSLVLGFLDLLMGQAQNRFFIDLEDWLFASAREEATPAASLEKLADVTAVNVDRFHAVMVEGEEGRRQTAAAIQSLAGGLEAFVQSQVPPPPPDNEPMYALLRAIDTGIGKLAADQAQTRLAQASLTQFSEPMHALLRSIDAGIRKMSYDLAQAHEAQARATEASVAQASLTQDRLAQADSAQEHPPQDNEAMYSLLRSIDEGIQKIANDQTQIRIAALEEARSEIKRLARVIELTVGDKVNVDRLSGIDKLGGDKLGSL